MAIWQRPSAVSLLAAHLRDELLRGRWSGRMPGVIRLAEELGVARNTVDGALKMLEREGLLVPQGHGRGRVIDLKGTQGRTGGLRLGFLLSEKSDQRLDYMLNLRHELAEEGHAVQFAPRYLLDLGMDVERVARVVAGMELDAWVVVGGSREVLEWFAARGTPVLALFGRRRHLRIASVGPDKEAALVAAVRKLCGLGHRRIVMLTRKLRRLPVPGMFEQAFLNELAAHGIQPGPYHLPDWEESPEGLQEQLEQLFKITPPSALILDEVPFFTAALDFCANRNIRVPEDVSLMCSDASPDFDWCRPAVAHIRWDSEPVVRRILRWAENVSRGKKDTRQTLTPAEFVTGGTVGNFRRGLDR